jgi:hypothetical protein
LWLLQVIEDRVFFLRFYEDSGLSIKDYVRLLGEWRQQYGYEYGRDFVPCDIQSNAQKIVTGQTALDVLRQLGRNAVPLEMEHRVKEGIERTKRFLHRCWFDKEGTEQGRDRVAAYHEGKNKQMSTEDRPVYTGQPEKDGNDHAADALRYASKAVEAGDFGGGMSIAEIDELEARYGRAR